MRYIFIAFYRFGRYKLSGKLAMTICPDILRELGAKYRIFMVTGTNGKTTTARIMEQILQENRIKYISNKSGQTS